MDSRQQNQARTSAQIESDHHLGSTHLSQAQRTAFLTDYSQAVTLLNNALDNFYAQYIVNPNPTDLITLVNYLKDAINSRYLFAFHALECGDVKTAKLQLNKSLETYYYFSKQDIRPKLTIAEIKKWKHYQSLHKELMFNKNKTSSRKHMTEDKGYSYRFEQIFNNGVSQLGQKGHCGFRSIGVTAESMRELIADCKAHDFEQIKVLIGDQIYNDYYENVDSKTKRVNLDNTLYTELSAHFEAYHAASNKQAEAMRHHKDVSNKPPQDEQEEEERLAAAVFLRKAQAELKQAEMNCVQFARRFDVIQNYLLNECKSNWIGSYMLLAWAKLAKHSLKIWQENNDSTLSSYDAFEYINPEDTDTIHIIQNKERNHFERLKLISRQPIVYSNTTLPYDLQRQEYEKSLKTLEKVRDSVEFAPFKEVTIDSMVKDIKTIYLALVPFPTEIKKVDRVTSALMYVIYALDEAKNDIIDDLTEQLFKDGCDVILFYDKKFDKCSADLFDVIYRSVVGHLFSFFEIKPVNLKQANLYKKLYRASLQELQEAITPDSELYGMIKNVLESFRRLRLQSPEIFGHEKHDRHHYHYMFFGKQTDFLYDSDVEKPEQEIKQAPSIR